MEVPPSQPHLARTRGGGSGGGLGGNPTEGGGGGREPNCLRAEEGEQEKGEIRN